MGRIRPVGQSRNENSLYVSVLFIEINLPRLNKTFERAKLGKSPNTQSVVSKERKWSGTTYYQKVSVINFIFQRRL